MNKIYKYKLDMVNAQSIELPLIAKILKVEYQRCNEEWDKINLCLWALIDDRLGATTKRTFRIFMTGEPIETIGNLIYIDTVLAMNGQFVAHVFEERTI